MLITGFVFDDKQSFSSISFSVLDSVVGVLGQTFKYIRLRSTRPPSVFTLYDRGVFPVPITLPVTGLSLARSLDVIQTSVSSGIGESGRTR